MFSKEVQEWLREEVHRPAPAREESVAEIPFAQPVVRRRVGIVAFACMLVALVGGLAVAGVMMDRPRTEPEAPQVASIPPQSEKPAHSVPQTVPVTASAKENCPCPDGCKCVGDCVCDRSKRITPAVSRDLTEKVTQAVQLPKEPRKPTPATGSTADKLEKIAVIGPKAEAAKPKAAISERSDKDNSRRLLLYDNLIEAQEAGKKFDRPVLVWTGGILESNPLAAKARETIGDLAINVEMDREGTDADRYGPRVTLKAPNDNTWYIRSTSFTDQTGESLRNLLPSRNYANIKFPQAEPPMDVRKRNTPEGLCLSCAVDTLGEYLGIETGLLKSPEMRSDAWKKPWMAWRLLDKKGIKSQWTPPGFNDIGYIRKTCDEGIGCTVGIHMNHEINVVGMDDRRVAIIDNSDPELKTRFVPREVFNRSWDGTSIVILPKGKEHILRMWGQCGPNGCVGQRELGGDGRLSETGRFSPEGFGNGASPSFPGVYRLGSAYRSNCMPSRASLMSQADPVEFWKAAGYSPEAAKKRADAVCGLFQFKE